jgi:hypothetical protein
MSTTTDLRTLAATVVRDAHTDLAAFFGHLAEDCRFAWANETPVQGVDGIQALVGRVLAGVSGFRHDIIEQLVGEDRAALRMDVTYTLPHGGELPTPAVTYTRFRDERIVEDLIYQDPTPLARAAGRRPSGRPRERLQRRSGGSRRRELRRRHRAVERSYTPRTLRAEK